MPPIYFDTTMSSYDFSERVKEMGVSALRTSVHEENESKRVLGLVSAHKPRISPSHPPPVAPEMKRSGAG